MSCPVCLEDFKNPVVLPCGHSLCQGRCSRKLIKHNKITCPKCRSTHWIPHGENLPKNYDLRHILQQLENHPPEVIVKCESHPSDTVTLFCTDCYVDVCVKCYVEFETVTSSADTPVHKQHKVIPIDQKNRYIQDLVQITTSYLKSKEEEEITYLSQLQETGETLQDIVENQCQVVKYKTKRLKKMLDDNSRRHIEFLKSNAQNPEMNDESCESLSRLQIYSNLLNKCEELSQSQPSKTNSEISRFLKSIDELPDCNLRPDPRCYLNIVDTSIAPVANVGEAVSAIRQCFNNTPVVLPSAPVIELDDCLVNEKSVAVSWKYKPTDKVGYFTVYYETAIFAIGRCCDKSSFIVDDFGRSSGHVTVRDLQPNKRYKLYVTANNEVGESPRSDILYFVASSSNPEKRIV